MEWDTVIEVATVVLQLLAGGGSTALIDWLKTQLGLTGNWALVLTAAVATVIAIATLVVEGALTAETVNWENLPAVIGVVFLAAHARYQMLKNQEAARQIAKAHNEAVQAQQLAAVANVEADGGGGQ